MPFVIIWVALTLLPLGAVVSADETAQTKLDQRQQDFTENQERLLNLQKAKDEARNRLLGLESQRITLKRESQKLAVMVKNVAITLTRQAAGLKTLEGQIIRQKARVKSLLKQGWRQASANSWRAFLMSEDPNALARQFAWLRYLVELRQKEIKAFVELKQRNTNLIDQMQKDQQRQASQRIQLENRDQRLLKLAHELKLQQVKQAELIASIRKEQTKIQEDIASLRNLIKGLDISASGYNYNGTKFIKGRLPWPVQGQVKVEFGEQRKGIELTWQGLLIAGKQGALVQAVHSGYIKYVGLLKGWGTVAVVDHGNNYMSVYGYNSQVLKRQGDFVETGEPLAVLPKLNSTARLPVLYFSIFKQGSPVDPAGLLTPR